MITKACKISVTQNNNASDSQCLINEHQVAELLQLNVGTLRNWRVAGGGPKYVRLSKKAIRYQYTEIMNWVDQRVVSNTSEYGKWEK